MKWWSDMSDEELRADLGPLVEKIDSSAEIVSVVVEDARGAAFVDLSNGDAYRFSGRDGITCWEQIGVEERTIE